VPTRMPNFKGYAVLLGAGASFGAKVGDATPPLDGDFLSVAQKTLGTMPDHSRERHAWESFTKALDQAGMPIGEVVNDRLEHLSTYLEARVRMSHLQGKRGRPRAYKQVLEELKKVVCEVLAARGGTRACTLHRKLFEWVTPSSVITFNYDLIADATLVEMGQLNWTAARYAGSKQVRLAMKGGRHRTVRLPRPRNRGCIPFLKLHGSIHWESMKKGKKHCLAGLEELPSRSLKYSRPPAWPMVVPPVAAKMEIADGALKKLWSEALSDLKSAPGWIIWGYSFPKTDTVTQVLCRAAMSMGVARKLVVVINPDASVADRVASSLGLKAVSVWRWPSIERFLYDGGRMR